MNTMGRRALAGTFAGLLLVAPAACGDDEDGDGGTTDEELQDVEDEADDLQDDAENVGDEVEEEVDSQDEGSNEDGE